MVGSPCEHLWFVEGVIYISPVGFFLKCLAFREFLDPSFHILFYDSPCYVLANC